MTMKRISFSILLCIIAYAAVFPFARTPASAQESPQPEIVIQVPIPGVTFPCSNQTGKQCVESFGEYINGFYKYFAGAMGVIAAMMVMWGGIKWLTAGGNSSRVKDAKDTVYSAMIALLLTFGSYILLYSINPEIVKLRLPTVNRVVPIEQAMAKCSQNQRSTIDFSKSTCNPNSEECCGKTMALNLGEGKTGECQWDISYEKNTLCVLSDYLGQYGDLPDPPVETVGDLCEKSDKGDRRDWCPAIDTMIRQAKMKDWSQKYVYTGCGFRNQKSKGDDCRWSLTLGKYFEAGLTLPSELSAFKPQFINCYTTGAKGVCWDIVNGTAQPLNCDGNQTYPCTSPTDVPRGVAGAAGGCLEKTVKEGKSTDYTCWKVPELDPYTEAPNGWGDPPTF
jgi:hypothetical protein